MRESLFRYSGNKGRLLPLLPEYPFGTKRIIEPFLGSGSYTLSKKLEGLGVDADPNVIELWKYLQGSTPEDLQALGTWWEDRKKNSPPPTLQEVEDLFGRSASLYFKINVCGIYVGQWSSNVMYSKFALPLKKTLSALPYCKKIDVRLGDWKSVLGELREGDMVFLDPPYFGTSGNYKGEDAFDPSEIVCEIRTWKVPVLFTYGTGAPEIFPELSWGLLTKRKVPNIRKGGTVERDEWISKINWPEEGGVLGLFGL